MLYVSQKNSVYHLRTKHIDAMYYKLRELIEKNDGEIQLMKVSAKDNVKDNVTYIMTKLISRG